MAQGKVSITDWCDPGKPGGRSRPGHPGCTLPGGDRRPKPPGPSRPRARSAPRDPRTPRCPPNGPTPSFAANWCSGLLCFRGAGSFQGGNPRPGEPSWGGVERCLSRLGSPKPRASMHRSPLCWVPVPPPVPIEREPPWGRPAQESEKPGPPSFPRGVGAEQKLCCLSASRACGVRTTLQACSAPLGGGRTLPIDCIPKSGRIFPKTLACSPPDSSFSSGPKISHRVTPMATLHLPPVRFTAARLRPLRPRGPRGLPAVHPPGLPAHWLSARLPPPPSRRGAHMVPGI